LLVAIVVFLVFVAGFTLLFRFTTQRIGQRVGEWVDRKHRAAEQIIETGMPPASWIAALPRGTPERRRRVLLRELRALAKYFERSPLVDTEETRREIVEILQGIVTRWKAASPGELLSPPAPQTPTEVP
jgi:hypothetical protein